ncbi:MAG: Trk system potassium transporter TrkA [Pseudomonadota bacterium]
MRVIICGAGLVGYSIASYLSRESNDITVVDHNPEMIGRINSELDANGIVGSAANPEILKAAGAEDADMIIAVTHKDEVNMVACQVAHSLFNVPKKIARIRDQVFLNPIWANLFSRAHMPIDVIISPEMEIAKAVEKRLSVPGTTSVISLSYGNIFLCGVLCDKDCPVVNTPMKQLRELFPNMNTNIILVIRDGKPFIPKANDQMLIGDEAYFVAEKDEVGRVLTAFGHEEQQARNIIIVGGGNIGLSLVERLRSKDDKINIKIIEEDLERAQYLSEYLDDITIINASGLERQILEEAGIDKAETLIAVTNCDETNILSCLLAQQYGCDRVVPLVNKGSYNNLTSSLGLGVIVSPKAITVSTVMKHIRRGRIKAVHNMPGNYAEVLEIEASDTLSFINSSIGSIKFPRGVFVCAIERDGEVIIPTKETVIKSGDRVTVMAIRGQANKVEKMFTAPVDLF